MSRNQKIAVLPLAAEHPLLPAAHALWLATFPLCERRDEAEQLKNLRHNPLFHYSGILHGDTLAGFFIWFDLPDFVFCEHFAMSPDVRGQGLGTAALAAIRADLRKPVLLEVEKPVNLQARRRIEFYLRNGFRLWDYEYRQPPYRSGGQWLPMCLMAEQTLDPSRAQEYEAALRKHVYGLPDNLPPGPATQGNAGRGGNVPDRAKS